jgi:hypothetical protein
MQILLLSPPLIMLQLLITALIVIADAAEALAVLTWHEPSAVANHM